MTEHADPSPIDYKFQLGAALKVLREKENLDRAAAARTLECSTAKIGTIERGRSAVSATELRALLELYKVSGDGRTSLEDLGREARKRKTPTPWGAVIPERLKQFFRIEEIAREIRYYHPSLIYGLTQTERYARTSIAANPALTPDDVDRLVQARMARQARLYGPYAPRITLVFSEAVLLQNVGGTDIMREQLQHLLKLVEDHGVEVRIVRFAVGVLPPRSFPFALLTPTAGQKTVAYLENLTDGVWVDDEGRVAQYETAFEELLAAALPLDDSVKLLASVVLEL